MNLPRTRILLLLAVIAALAAGTGCGRKRSAKVKIPGRPGTTTSTRTRPVPAVVRPVGYVEHGYASWYGHPYHGRATSSGEIYDMRAMTAAHRTLPFGTEVEVKNLETGSKTRVRINDRGPFIDGRIIDLSLTAAREIEVWGPGTALVEVKVVRVPEAVAGNGNKGPAPQPSAVSTAAVSGRYTVQVGAFADRNNAERLRDTLTRRYPQFPVNVAPTPDGGRLRVWVGNENNEASAEAIANRLRQDQVTAFVVRLD